MPVRRARPRAVRRAADAGYRFRDDPPEEEVKMKPREWKVEYRCWVNDGASGGPTIVYAYTANGLKPETVCRRAAQQTGCKPCQVRITDANWRR